MKYKNSVISLRNYSYYITAHPNCVTVPGEHFYYYNCISLFRMMSMKPKLMMNLEAKTETFVRTEEP